MPSRKIYQKGEIVMEVIASFIFGFLASWVFIKLRLKNGNFQINETDANKDVYTLMVDDFDKLHKRKFLLLRITRK